MLYTSLQSQPEHMLHFVLIFKCGAVFVHVKFPQQLGASDEDCFEVSIARFPSTFCAQCPLQLIYVFLLFGTAHRYCICMLLIRERSATIPIKPVGPNVNDS